MDVPRDPLGFGIGMPGLGEIGIPIPLAVTAKRGNQCMEHAEVLAESGVGSPHQANPAGGEQGSL